MANNPNVRENLRPFKKGDDPRRNTTGQNRKLPDLKELMAKILGEEKDGITAAEAILAAQRSKAAKGDAKAADFLFNRGYGMPNQKTDVNLSGAINLNFDPQDQDLGNDSPISENENSEERD